MEKKRVLITAKLPGDAFEMFQKSNEYNVLVLNPQDDISSKVKEFNPHGIISLLSNPITREIMSFSPELLVISNYAVGYNNIDISAAKELKISVTNTPGVLTDATADIAFLLILMLTRRALPAEKFTRERHFSGWMPELFLAESAWRLQLAQKRLE